MILFRLWILILESHLPILLYAAFPSHNSYLTHIYFFFTSSFRSSLLLILSLTIILFYSTVLSSFLYRRWILLSKNAPPIYLSLVLLVQLFRLIYSFSIKSSFGFSLDNFLLLLMIFFLFCLPYFMISSFLISITLSIEADL